MNVYILDKSFDRLGEVDVYASFLWSPAFNDVGSFELDCPISFFDLLQDDRLVQNTDDADHIGVIEFITKVEEADGTETLKVRGRMAESLLSRRVALGITTFTNQQPFAIISQLVTENAITPTDSTRQISGLEMGSSVSAPLISYTSNNGNLLTEVGNICKASGLGFRLKVDDDLLKQTLEIYTGTDRTDSQVVVEPVILSRDRDNVLTVEYTKDTTNYATYVYIRGEGELQTYVTRGSETSLDRREIFLDLSSIPRTVNDVTMSEPDYIKVLQQEAVNQLAKMVKSELLYNSINVLGNLKYSEDFFLGDLITCVDNTLGFSVDLRITGVTESWGNDGYSIALTLGEETPDLKDLMALNAMQTPEVVVPKASSVAWQVPTFQNGWVNYDTTYNSAGYYKDANNRVYAKGLVKTGTANTVIFTFPAGYRPLKRGIFVTVSNNAIARIDVLPNGEVKMESGSNAWISLETISFLAEQ